LVRQLPAKLVRRLAELSAAQQPINAAPLEMLASDCLLHVQPDAREDHAKLILETIPKDYEGGEAIRHLRAATTCAVSPTSDHDASSPNTAQALDIPTEFKATTAEGVREAIA